VSVSITAKSVIHFSQSATALFDWLSLTHTTKVSSVVARDAVNRTFTVLGRAWLSKLIGARNIGRLRTYIAEFSRIGAILTPVHERYIVD